MPLSPLMSTRASVAATILAWFRISFIAWLRVIISADQSSSTSTDPETLMALFTVCISSSLSIGFVRKPKAPLWVATTASGMVPCAVMITTRRPGERVCSSFRSPIPSILSMRRSVMTRSGLKRFRIASALWADSTASTS